MALILNEKLNEILNNIIQTDHLRKKNARIYIPPAIVKKPRKLENWKYFGSSKPFSKKQLDGDFSLYF